MDFEKVCMLFSMQEPYYGILLSSMEHIESKKIDTLCMARSNNVFKLYYNKEFFNRFDVDTQIELIRHEVLHNAFNHFCIWSDEEKKNATPQMTHLMQIAADLDVNCYLKRQNMQKEAGGVFCEDLGFEKNQGAREYLRLLVQKFQNQNQQQQAQNPQKPCNGGKGNGTGKNKKQKQNKNNQENQNQGDADDGQNYSSGNNMPSEEELKSELPALDDHSQWPDMDENEAEQLTQAIEDLLVFAAEEVEKSRGTIPGEIAGKIKLLREKKKPKPVADWKRYFRRYLGNEFTEKQAQKKIAYPCRYRYLRFCIHARISGVLRAARHSEKHC